MHSSVLSDPPVPRVSLGEVDDLAPLPIRYENRFVIDNDGLGSLIEALAGSHRVLEVAGSTSNEVHNVYLDTMDFMLFRAHLRRSRRWKLRLRTYCSTGMSRAELKVRDARGRTTKVYGALGRDARSDQVKQLGHEALDARALSIVDGLEPSMEISYLRTTLVDPERGERITVDNFVQFRCPDGTFVGGLLPGWSVIETKSRRPRARVTETLRTLGARELAATKYTAAIALAGQRRLVPEALRDLRRYFYRAERHVQKTPGSA